MLDDEVVMIGGESPRQQLAHDEVEALDVANGTWRSLPPLLIGRHGTGVISNPRGLFIAGGCAQRGGDPEITNLQWRPSGDRTAAIGEPIVRSNLAVKSVAKVASGKLRVTLASTDGNQAFVLAYGLTTGGGVVEFEPGFPYVMPPNSTLDIDVGVSGAGDDAVLLVRELANEVDPVVVPLG